MFRMMIVDDEEKIVNSLYGYLSECFDLEIYRALSGEEADALIHRMRFDIILSDISMPGLSGLDLLDRAKRLWPACFFILLTAYNQFDFAYRALKYERVDYILKIESYDLIRDTVAEKIRVLEEERRLVRLPEAAEDPQALYTELTRYFLKRIIVRGTPLPDDRDLEELHLPLRLHAPALLVIGTANASLRERDQLMRSAQEYLTRSLSPWGLAVLFYPSAGRCVWAVQQKEDNAKYTPQEAALFVRETFGALFQMQEEKRHASLALVCCGAFAPWNALHALYQRALVALEGVREEGGMVMLPTEEAAKARPPRFPTLDEVNMLWELLRRGQKEAFLKALSEGLAAMRTAEAPPASARAALSLLFSEALNLYGMPETEESRLIRASDSYATGEEWAKDSLTAAERLFEQRKNARQDTDTWLIRRIEEYLEAHFAEDVTLSTLAETAHYNPSYLSRFYKQHTGKNLMGRLNEVRIDHAKRLLADTGMKSGEIAEQCGFCSTKYFNQAFKKATGQTPGEFREGTGMRERRSLKSEE